MSTDLFTKITIGGQELQNRMVLAPLTRARCDPGLNSTQANDLMKEYYTQRASAGLIITEATAISEEGYGWLNAPMISTEEHAASWKPIVDAVHEKGGKIFLQLWHLGRQAHSSFHPSTNDIVSASAIPMKSGNAKNNKGENVEWETPRALTIPQIKDTVQDYVKAARLCKQAGFDGVEVHSANGYLLDQFLQSSTNERTDEYGSSMENRARFLLEVVEALIADGAYPAGSIGVRLSPNGAFGEMGSEDNDVMFPFVATQLSKYELAYLVSPSLPKEPQLRPCPIGISPSHALIARNGRTRLRVPRQD
jgi:N-ethylmaleimide reductase